MGLPPLVGQCPEDIGDTRIESAAAAVTQHSAASSLAVLPGGPMLPPAHAEGMVFASPRAYWVDATASTLSRTARCIADPGARMARGFKEREGLGGMYRCGRQKSARAKRRRSGRRFVGLPGRREGAARDTCLRACTLLYCRCLVMTPYTESSP